MHFNVSNQILCNKKLIHNRIPCIIGGEIMENYDDLELRSHRKEWEKNQKSSK